MQPSINTPQSYTLKDAIATTTTGTPPSYLEEVLTATLANKYPEIKHPTTHEELLALIDTQLAKCADTKAKLWGCELAAKKEVEAAEAKLQSKRAQACASIRHEKVCALYPKVLNSAVFDWRTSEGWPALSPFNLHQSELHFVMDGWVMSNRSWVDEDGRESNACFKYDDVFEAMKRKACKEAPSSDWRTYTRATLGCEFSGTIPTDVKTAIKTAEDTGVFDTILLLAETPDWSWGAKYFPSVKVDPIVIGWTGKDWHVIAVFDLSPLEDLALGL